MLQINEKMCPDIWPLIYLISRSTQKKNIRRLQTGSSLCLCACSNLQYHSPPPVRGEDHHDGLNENSADVSEGERHS